MDWSLSSVQIALKPKKSIADREKPRKRSKSTDIRTGTLSQKYPFASPRAISADTGNVISSRTFCLTLQEVNFPGRIDRRVPLRKQKNSTARLVFSRNHYN